MFKKINPVKLILCWVLLLFIVGIIFIPILFATTVGGEQKSLTFLVQLIQVGKYGTLTLSVITPFFYFKWFKKYWYTNLLFFTISGYFVINDQRRNAKIEYGIKEETKYINKDEIKSLKEYYSFDPERIRSEKYWINGKKDSIWIIYTKDGTILDKNKYEKDTLVETSK